ncbi:gastrula zinc finger protein XlCGF8.2DB isoform X1 [Colias croceus]|uniref:gastrula zinc finger protein XlCGF8.2DB isoform X1 n=1 Tax=Colias crocea TaxID=72248 RepID=UPI001E27EDCF|nr:gastrula zinc finger protein XlCGF8.2DB isoform X1 [Colias croceus]
MDLSRCRLCLQDIDGNNGFRSLFETLENDTVIIGDKVATLTKIEIHPDDDYPKSICNTCVKKLNDCIEFIELCQQSDIKLKNVKVESDDELYIDLDVKEENVDSKCEIVTNDDINNTQATKSRKQQCSTCGKVMSSRYRLKTHLVTHTGERAFPCTQCGKKFSLAQTRNVHMRIHTGEKPFRCSICGNEFAQSSGLIAHKRKHTGQLPYSCKLCPRQFRTIGHLQYHVRRHTGQKNFECDTCGRAFITRHHMKQHLLTHSSEKRLVCCVCGLRLSRTSNLKRHIRLAHNGVDTLQDSKVISKKQDISKET